MRYLILVVMILTMFFVAPRMTVAGDVESFCANVSKAAGAIMQKRQENVDISKLMATLPEEGQVRKILKAIIIDAYNSPSYSTEKYKREAVMKFKNAVYIDCFEAMDN